MIDTTKPLEYVYASGDVSSYLMPHFVGFNKDGDVVVQIGKAYYGFTKEGKSKFATRDYIRNVKKKTKLYYKTLQNNSKDKFSSQVICLVSGEPLEKPLPDYYKNFTVVDTFERETEL